MEKDAITRIINETLLIMERSSEFTQNATTTQRIKMLKAANDAIFDFTELVNNNDFGAANERLIALNAEIKAIKKTDFPSGGFTK